MTLEKASGRFGPGVPDGIPFIVISGDVLTDIDLTKAWEFHQEKKAAATVVLTRTVKPLAYGVVITDESGRISRFLEKPFSQNLLLQTCVWRNEL